MARFAAGEVDVLVATSVIEVGIDVAERDRDGDRGGRPLRHLAAAPAARPRRAAGEHESYCLLFSDARSELARRRLEAVAAERDGFRLAEVDLTLRGEGDVLGTKPARAARVPGRAAARGLPSCWSWRARESIELLAADPELAGPGARAAARGARAPLRRARGRADRGLRLTVRVVAGAVQRAAPAGAARRRTRPTADRVREALFSILGPVDGLRVLDLYAGSGALGIEALSRGARDATFVDSDAAAVRAVRENLERLGVDEAPRVRAPTRCPSCGAPPATASAGTWCSATRHIDSRHRLGRDARAASGSGAGHRGAHRVRELCQTSAAAGPAAARPSGATATRRC